MFGEVTASFSGVEEKATLFFTGVMLLGKDRIPESRNRESFPTWCSVIESCSKKIRLLQYDSSPKETLYPTADNPT